jgi:hypothetical protein
VGLWERYALFELRYGNATRYLNCVMGTLRVMGTVSWERYALLENLRFYGNCVVGTSLLELRCGNFVIGTAL